MKYVIGLLIFLGGIALAGLAISYILWQQRAMTEFVETPATILSTHVEAHRSKKSTSYSPEITYQYTVGGRSYQSSQVFTFSSNGSESWANSVLRQYPPAPHPAGAVEAQIPIPNAKAYVNPRDPNDAILVRRYFFTPYLFAYIALLAALIGLGGALTDAFTVQNIPMRALALDDSGWQLLLPRQNLRRRLRNAAIWCATWALLVLPLELHWLVYAHDYSLGPLIGSLLPLLYLAALAITVFRRWSLTRHISDVRLRARPVPMQRGQPFALAMEADALTTLHVSGVTAKVVCTEHYKERRGNKTHTGTRTKAEKTISLSPSTTITPGQILEGTGETTFQPADCPPSSDLTIKIHPYYTWEVRLTIKLEHAVDYAAVFPLEVE